MNISYNIPRLKALPIRERPDFRVKKDPDMCNLSELLSVIIGGTEQIEIAERLILTFGNIHAIANAQIEELSSVDGIGQKTALRIKACMAVGRKLFEAESVKQFVRSPADAAKLLIPILSHREQEYLVVMPLDTRNRVIDIIEIYHGSLNCSMVRVCELFRPAIQRNAAQLIVSHNHPSMDPTPSPEDITLSNTIFKVGSAMDMEVIDHIVIGGNGSWASIKSRTVFLTSGLSKSF
jgi:DNA repair protein RadC